MICGSWSNYETSVVAMYFMDHPDLSKLVDVSAEAVRNVVTERIMFAADYVLQSEARYAIQDLVRAALERVNWGEIADALRAQEVRSGA